MTDDNRHNSKFLFGFFIGGLLGAIIIFFLGTKDGKKTGKILEEKGKKFLDEIRDHIDEYEEKGKEFVEKGEEIKEQVIEQIEEKKDAIGKDVSDKLETALSHIEGIQERGRQTTAMLRKKLFKNLPKKI